MKLCFINIILLIIGSLEIYAQDIIHFDNMINTQEDEFLPNIINNKLIFGRTYKLETIPISQYSIRIIENFSINNITQSREIVNLPQPTKISDYINSDNFKFNMIKHKIYNSRNTLITNDKYFYDFHPALSPDGLYIVFVSDRIEKNLNSDINTTDLYITFKLADGYWSEPYNLGPEINSNENEITPFIDNHHNLYFARKVYKNNHWNYDILIAKPIGKGKWSNPQPLKFPINTEYNETGPFIIADTILFASDRINKNNKDKHRNYDIYCFINQQNTKISINLKKIMEPNKKINFFNYEIPFFVTGYYYPNTPENLKKLREKFQNGTLGKNPQLSYIANPDYEIWDYDSASFIIKQSLDYACNQIISELKNLKNTNNPIFLTFTGYCDSRKIIENQIYYDTPIKSLNPYLFVEKGEKMDNFLLSKLRAYYTAMEIKNKLINIPTFKKYKDKIIFIVKGNGSVNDENTPNYRQRRVEITLKIDTNKKIEINSLPNLEKQGLSSFTE